MLKPCKPAQAMSAVNTGNPLNFARAKQARSPSDKPKRLIAFRNSPVRKAWLRPPQNL